MRIYEEYRDKTEKKRAQRGAKLGKPTGKARGFILVFPEYGQATTGPEGTLNAIGCFHELEVGGEPLPMIWLTPSVDYLRHNCRRVAARFLPDEWKAAFNRELVNRGERKLAVTL